MLFSNFFIILKSNGVFKVRGAKMLSYIFFSFYVPYIIINSDDLNYKEKEGVLLVHSSCFPRGCISLPD